MLDKEKFFNKKCYLLDGAMGTYLIDLGFNLNSTLWSAKLLIDKPQIISKIHSEYIQAGADIITTNTFRTNPTYFNYTEINLTNAEFVRKAVDIAKNSIPDNFSRKVFIAGSNAPAEDCYNQRRTLSYKELFQNHSKHIEYLIESDVDFILNETFGDKEEIEIVCKICSENKFPFAVSILIKDEDTTFFGQNLTTTLDLVSSFSPLFISINCVRPEIILKTIPKLKKFGKWGTYPNLGSRQSFTTGKLIRDYDNNQLSNFVTNLLQENAFVIGTCCGSNPSDTKLIRNLIDTFAND